MLHFIFGVLQLVCKRFQHLEHEEALDRNSNAQEHYQKLNDSLYTNPEFTDLTL